MRRRVVLALLLLLAPLSLLLAVAIGSVAIDPASLTRVLRGTASGVQHTLVFELRLPRAVAAFAVGGMLALAGSLLQVLLRNPLADPYVIGVSGGAAVAALLALLAGATSNATSAAAFGGALGSMLLVFALSRAGPGGTHRLLLTGVVLAAGWGACISLLLVMAPATQVQGMLFWLLGDLSNARYGVAGLVVLTLGLTVSMVLGRALNVLLRGESVAAALGENPKRLRTVIYVLASLLTGTAVTLAGSIGFVGLIVPHLLRLLGLSDHRVLLPAATLLGGSLLVVADTLARTMLAPVQLPVGVLTALLGVPVFLFLLARDAQRIGA
jgi:iron complex transport system permease protein